MQPIPPGEHGWGEKYDTLARNLAAPALEEITTLRTMILQKGEGDRHERQHDCHDCSD
jgi:hypothetical protein